MDGRHAAHQGYPTRFADANDIGHALDPAGNTHPGGTLDGTGCGSKESAFGEGGLGGDPNRGGERGPASRKGTLGTRDGGRSRHLGSARGLGDGTKGANFRKRDAQKGENENHQGKASLCLIHDCRWQMRESSRPRTS